ncbi:MAG: hypothetical protein P1U56_22385 [Saprospiraceae bacterium]|nr:hypothetical protein [Saprospiraceae bacterium]
MITFTPLFNTLCLFFSLLLLGNNNQFVIEPTVEYTYELSIATLTDKEEQFDLYITSQLDGDTEEKTTEQKSLTTPFKQILGTGIHTIKIHGKGPDQSIISKIEGIVRFARKGSATSTKQYTLLEAGPGGKFTLKPYNGNH